MSAEAWVALGIGLSTIVVTILGAILGAGWKLSAQLAKAITRFELVGTQQANELKEVKEAVIKFGDVVSLVAVQKEEIRSLRETEAQNTKRTDLTFERVFARLDKLTES